MKTFEMSGEENSPPHIMREDTMEFWRNKYFTLLKKYQDLQTEVGWERNPDTSGGAFRKDEIERARNNDY